ncbi:amino acid ABC transporter substrate-binding protein [bacterium]|nr:amino acid ABC transporter substrate-binding protein [bacterium]NBX72225.1 amino acid ABC transporter substrate-binding protein [bacterium]
MKRLKNFYFIVLLISCFEAHATELPPIKIGVSSPVTGGSYSMGIGLRNGIRIAADEINAAGGVLGRKIQLVERDDQANPDLGLKQAEDLVKNEKVIAVVGYSNTGVILKCGHLYQEAKIPLMLGGAVGTKLTKIYQDQAENYFFRTAPRDEVQSIMIVREALEKRGFKKVALLTDTTPYGVLGREDLLQALNKYQMVPVSDEKFKVGDTDMMPQLSKAKAAGAECILVYGIGPELAHIAIDMKKLGWNNALIGCQNLAQSSFIEKSGKDGVGACMPQSFIQAGNSKKRKWFIETYMENFNPSQRRMESAMSSAQGYDSLKILAAGIEQAGSTDGSKIVNALENLNATIDGIITTYSRPYSHTDHEAVEEEATVMGMVRQGRVVYAYREDAVRANAQ